MGITTGRRTNRDGIRAVLSYSQSALQRPHGSHLTFPEIPCSYDADWSSLHAYQQCVDRALGELEDAGLLDPGTLTHFRSSAIEACQQRH